MGYIDRDSMGIVTDYVKSFNDYDKHKEILKKVNKEYDTFDILEEIMDYENITTIYTCQACNKTESGFYDNNILCGECDNKNHEIVYRIHRLKVLSRKYDTNQMLKLVKVMNQEDRISKMKIRQEKLKRSIQRRERNIDRILGHLG